MSFLPIIILLLIVAARPIYSHPHPDLTTAQGSVRSTQVSIPLQNISVVAGINSNNAILPIFNNTSFVPNANASLFSFIPPALENSALDVDTSTSGEFLVVENSTVALNTSLDVELVMEHHDHEHSANSSNNSSTTTESLLSEVIVSPRVTKLSDSCLSKNKLFIGLPGLCGCQGAIQDDPGAPLETKPLLTNVTAAIAANSSTTAEVSVDTSSDAPTPFTATSTTHSPPQSFTANIADATTLAIPSTEVSSAPPSPETGPPEVNNSDFTSAQNSTPALSIKAPMQSESTTEPSVAPVADSAASAVLFSTTNTYSSEGETSTATGARVTDAMSVALSTEGSLTPTEGTGLRAIPFEEVTDPVLAPTLMSNKPVTPSAAAAINRTEAKDFAQNTSGSNAEQNSGANATESLDSTLSSGKFTTLNYDDVAAIQNPTVQQATTTGSLVRGYSGFVAPGVSVTVTPETVIRTQPVTSASETVPFQFNTNANPVSSRPTAGIEGTVPSSGTVTSGVEEMTEEAGVLTNHLQPAAVADSPIRPNLPSASDKCESGKRISSLSQTERSNLIKIYLKPLNQDSLNDFDSRICSFVTGILARLTTTDNARLASPSVIFVDDRSPIYDNNLIRRSFFVRNDADKVVSASVAADVLRSNGNRFEKETGLSLHQVKSGGVESASVHPLDDPIIQSIIIAVVVAVLLAGLLSLAALICWHRYRSRFYGEWIVSKEIPPEEISDAWCYDNDAYLGIDESMRGGAQRASYCTLPKKSPVGSAASRTHSSSSGSAIHYGRLSRSNDRIHDLGEPMSPQSNGWVVPKELMESFDRESRLI